jgi:uncharacterized spore protein YtfJ
MGVEATIKEIAGELEKIATTKTVVGEPITAAGKTIVPISRITMGFGAGGGEGKKDNESGYGGGGGAGVKIEPVAFIMISEDEARIFRISEKNDAGSILSALPDMLPDIMDKLKRKDKHKKEDTPRERENIEQKVKEEKPAEHTEDQVQKGSCFQ